MANGAITLKGIDQAISSLNYRKDSIKEKFILSIRRQYDSDQSTFEINSIDADKLIQIIWDIQDEPVKIKSKRKNFNSIRSAVKSDMEKLYCDTENPERITINSSNIFDMNEDAKNNILNSFSDVIKTSDYDPQHISEILTVITDLLKDIEAHPVSEKNSFSEIISKIKTILNTLDGDEMDVVLSEEDEFEKLDESEGQDEESDEIEYIDEQDEESDEIEYIDEQDEESDEIEYIDEQDEESDEIEYIDELDEDELLELDEDGELETLEDDLDDFEQRRKQKNFDDLLGEREKDYNIYVVVPRGRYTIGSKKKGYNFLPIQEIDMKKLFFGKYPVTNSLFEIFILETGYITTAEKKGYGTVFTGRFKRDQSSSVWRGASGSAEIKGACWHRPDGPGSSLYNKRNHPVVQVSINDAWSFASWIGRRLPTETEWEAAARTDNAYSYPWGNNWEKDACNLQSTALSTTNDVDTYNKYQNDFKISDLLGNVLEWTADTVLDPLKENSGKVFYVAKGGGWTASDDITLGSRFFLREEFTSNTVGFRCVSEFFL